MVCKLSNEVVLNKLSKWKLAKDDRDAINRSFKFIDFKAALAFMTNIALKAEEIGHHPEWFNVYNKLTVTLTTHDAGGLSEKDLVLGKYLDTEYEKVTNDQK